MDKSLLYLYTPSASKINPPVDTKIQMLPVEQLGWEDFEKLCLRLAQLEHSIDNCEIYGIKGQKQQGIDIFAQKENAKYSSYQCKRYQEVTEDVLEKAVNKFRDEEWKPKSDKFYFCTTAALNLVQLQDKFNQLKTELQMEGIELIKWDKIQIESLMKDQPQIVYDFFGKEWTRLFNGEDKLNEVVAKRKLDSNQVIKFRKDLADLYSIAFNNYDPGIPIQELNNQPFLIQDRFIIPDVEQDAKDLGDDATSEETAIKRSNKVETSLAYGAPNVDYYRDDEYFVSESWDADLVDRTEESGNKNIRTRSSDFENVIVQRRANIDTVLPAGKKIMIIGDPGYGKSTLLRYIILDLLSNAPTLSNLSQTWGRYLPVWLPFAFITKNLNDHPNLNISELLHLWFKSLDKEQIFDVVKDALVDERLLLIIDGVDEWTNTNAARQAISKIEIHADSHQSIVVYSSRPYGYKLLSDSFPKVQEFRLCPFSEEQQKGFIFNWYSRWTKAINKVDASYAQNETISFLEELKKSNDLSYLAESPLLLSILITQRMRDSFLPKNKLKALEAISEYLINQHPLKRKITASIIDHDTLDFDLTDIFTELAFHIQQHSNDGVILRSEAAKIIEVFLTTSMHYEGPRAKKLSTDLLKIGANNIGIIIEKSNDEVAFVHRQFQEYLAAQYISELDKDEINSILLKYSDLPVWHQVVTNFFGLIPSRSFKNFNEHLTNVQTSDSEKETELYVKFLKYELALHLSNAPIDTSKTYLHAIFSDFDRETIRSFKTTLLKIILDGLENSKIKQEIKTYLFQFFPNHYKYDDYRIIYLRQVPIESLSDAQIDFMVFSLLNGNTNQRYSASITLKRFIKHQRVFDAVLNILQEYSHPEVTEFALNTMISDDVEQSVRRSLLAKFTLSEHPDIKFFVLKLRVNLKLNTYDDLEAVLYLQRGISYLLRQEIIDIFIDGWPNDERLLERCMKSVKRNSTNFRELEDEVAWKILFHCFNSRKEVIDLIIKEIQSGDFPFIGLHSHGGWPYLLNYFRDNQDLIPVVDQWLDKQKFQDPQLAYASLIGRTGKSKQKLLSRLPKDGTPHWSVMALWDGWNHDPEVIIALKKYFTEPNKNKHYAAQFISKLFADDPASGVAILKDIIFDRESFFRDRAIQPLIELDSVYFESYLLERFLAEELPLLSKGDFNQYYNALYPIVEKYPHLPVVEKLVFSILMEGMESLDMLVKFYPEQTDKIDELLKLSRPLNPELRLKILQKIREKPVVDAEILHRLSKFNDEQEEVIKSTAAIDYFNLTKTTSPDKILSICSENVFYRGHDYEIQRQIAFCGYLIAGELKTYFSLKEEGANKEPSPNFIFESHRNKMSQPMIKLLVNNFDNIIAEIGIDFKKILKHNREESEPVWSFFLKIFG